MGRGSLSMTLSFLAVIVLAQSAPVAPATPPDPQQAARPSAATPTATTPPAPDATAAQSAPADVVVKARAASPADPLERVNVKSYRLVQNVDQAVAEPIAIAYKKGLPSPVRTGVRNFVYNVREPSIFVNFLLQHKLGKAFETLGRFTVNSTLGVGGLLDVARAKPFKLPRRRNGFANTFGFYGVKQGAYLFLPFVGPTTVRDLIGDTMDRFMLPVLVRFPFSRIEYVAPTVTLSVIDSRAEFEDDLQKFRAQPDGYLARREFYLRYRQAEIDQLHGRDTPLPTVPAAPTEPAQPDATATPADAAVSGSPNPPDAPRD